MKTINYLLLAILFVIGCQKEVELTSESEEQIFLNEADMQGMTKLGKQLENPYSVSNMKKAIDNTNQGLSDITRPFDRVSGYTIAQIEAVIPNSSNIQNLRDNLRNRYPNNPTRGFLDELFEQYINLSR